MALYSKVRMAVLRGADATIGARLAADLAAFSDLPPTPFDISLLAGAVAGAPA